MKTNTECSFYISQNAKDHQSYRQQVLHGVWSKREPTFQVYELTKSVQKSLKMRREKPTVSVILLFGICPKELSQLHFLGFYCCEKTHDHSNSYKEQIIIWPGLQFQRLLHYCHSSMQADIVLEKELRALYLDHQAAR